MATARPSRLQDQSPRPMVPRARSRRSPSTPWRTCCQPPVSRTCIKQPLILLHHLLKKITKRPSKYLTSIHVCALIINLFLFVFSGTNGKEKPKSTEKKVEKPKTPITLSQAVKENLRVEDLKNLLEMSQTRFPDSPLLWLRDIATYLNQKLVYTNQDEFTNFGGDPSSILTANMRKVINVMFQKCSDSMKETFFETCISNTAHELQKGSKTIE